MCSAARRLGGQQQRGFGNEASAHAGWLAGGGVVGVAGGFVVGMQQWLVRLGGGGSLIRAWQRLLCKDNRRPTSLPGLDWVLPGCCFLGACEAGSGHEAWDIFRGSSRSIGLRSNQTVNSSGRIGLAHPCPHRTTRNRRCRSKAEGGADWVGLCCEHSTPRAELPLRPFYVPKAARRAPSPVEHIL